MTTRIRLWITIALLAPMVLAAAPAAHAITVLVTPMITVPKGDSVGCRIVNTGIAPITVRIELLKPDGDDYFTDDGVVVRPGRAHNNSAVIASATLHAYCRFSGNFNKAYVRASIDDYDIGESRTAVMAPAE